MSTLRASRPVAVLLLVTLWPALGLAQSAPPAGVVTGLQGRANLVRPIVAQPIPLKFKDDLFLRDQVETRENSLVRVLLGGKALVTIRELSTFSIIEEPGRAAIDLKSGKIAVGVAKSLLKPGEAIEIRTPNAIAAVRGSLLVATVTCVGGPPGDAACKLGVTQSSFTALDASLPITVTPLSGSMAPVALNANQAVGVSGIGASTSVGPVQNVTPEVARREAQTATAPRAADGQGAASPMAAQISVAKAQEAAMLASLIAPAAGATPPPADATLASATQTQLLQEPGSTLTTASQTAFSSVPPPPSTGSLGVNAGATETASLDSTPTAPDGGTPPPVEPPPVVPPPVVPPPVVPPPVVPPPGGPVVISNQNLALAADQTLKTYSGQSASADTTAAVTVTNSTVTGAGNLIVVEPGANASLAGPLLDVTGPAATPAGLTASSSVVDIRGVLSSTTTGSFINIDPTLVITTDFLRIAGGSLNLAGPLLNDVQGTYGVTGDFLSIQGGVNNGTLTASGAAPLLQFSGSLLGLGAPVSVRPNRLLALGVGSTASLGGSLVSLTNNSTLGIGGPAGSALVAIAPGSALTSTSASPLADLSGSAMVLGPGVPILLATGGTASIGGNFLRAAAASTILGDLNVPIVDLTNAGVNIIGALVRLEGGSLLQSGGVKVTGGSLTANALVSTDGLGNILTIGGTALDLTNAGATLGTLGAIPDTDTVALNLGLNQPALRLSSSALTLTNVNDTVLSLGVDGGPVLPTIPGVGVITGGVPTAPSTLSLKGTLFELAGVNATATQPMVQLEQTTVVQTETGNDLISVLVPTEVTSTMAGSLLSVTNSTLNTSGRLTRFSGGALTSATASPFLFFDPSSITSAQQMIQLDSGFNLTLAGPLVSAQNTSFHINDPSASAFGFATILDGAKLTTTGTGPLLTFDASSFNGGNVVNVRRSASTLNPSTLTLAGPLLLAANGSSFNTSSSGLGPILGTGGGACCSLVSISQGGQLFSTTASPLVQLTGSQVFAGPDAQSGGSIFSVTETFAAAPSGELVAPSSVVLQGPLLTASGSSLSALFNLLLVARSSFGSTTTAPLIQLNGTTVNLGGVDPFTETSSQSRLVVVSGSSAFPASLSLHGPLVGATNSEITSGQEILGVFNGASLTNSHPGALFSINGGSATAGTAVPPGQGGNFFSFASSVGLAPSASLAGPLLDAVNTTLVNGNPVSNTFSFMFIGDSAAVTSTSTAPFLAFDNVSLTASAGILSLRRSLSAGNPTTLTLGGPLFAAINGSSFNVTSSAFGSTCCTGFSLGQGVQLVSTGTEALIQLTNSTFNAGPHPQAGGGNVMGVFDTGVCCGETNLLVAPSNVGLAGPLLSAANSQISALFNVLSVNRSSFTSTGIGPLVEITGSTVSLGGVNPFGNIETAAKVLTVVSSPVSGTIASPTSVSLAGPLLRATDSSLSMTEDVVEIFGGGTFSSQTSAPLIQLNNTSLTAGTPTLNGDVLEVGGTGGSGGATPSSANLSGPLLSAAAGSSLNTTGSFFVGGSPGGGVTTVSGLSAPFVLITGGTHAVASNAGVGMFRLFGNGSVAADAESGLSLGTYRPLQSAAVLADGSRPIPVPLLETVGATVTGQKILRMDTALLEATAPLFNLRSNGAVPSTLNATGTDAIDLSFGSRVSALGSSLIRLDNSVLNVVNGSLVNVNASKLTVGGDFISLLNGAKLTLGAGSLLSVQGGGFASIGGALVSFGGTGGNAITVNNGLVPTGFINGIPVFSSLGGTTGFSITNSAPLVGLNTLGTITINGAPLPSNATAASGITGSLIGIQGTGGQVKIGLQ